MQILNLLPFFKNVQFIGLEYNITKESQKNQNKPVFFCLLIPEIFKKTEKRFTFEISFSQKPISLLLVEI